MATKKSLEAAAATAGMFTEAKEQEKPKTKKATRQQPEPEAKRDTATFSVKIDSEVLKRWRYYASANGYGDKGKLTEAALVEYMNRHKLTPEQQAKVDLLCNVDL